MTASERIARWRLSPLAFVREVFGVEPDAWQADELEHLATPASRRRECMKACTGPGKSAVLAWIGWWRLLCFAERGEHPKGAALSITADNLKDNLWAELSKWQSRSEMLRAAFTWTKERIFARDHPETWFLSARAFSKDADAESIGRTLSGLHSQYAFVLIDEAGDMPTAVLRSAEQIFTGSPKDAGIFMAGNPTSTDGALYAACNQQRDQWHITTITADPDDPKRTPRVDIELAREQIRLYGRDNPWVMSTILGLFPPGAFNALLSLDEVESAMGRHLPAAEYEWSQKRLGVDVARQGDDRTVIFPRQGKASFMPVIMRNATGPQVAARVAQARNKWGSELELVDGTGGYGAGVVDALNVARLSPVEVQFAGRATDPRYANKRAEMWFLMAEWIKSGGALPNLPGLARELTGPTYTFQNGRFQLEAKEQIKKRLGFSPDLADALALTFGLPDMPTRMGLAEGLMDREARKSRHDYDPYGSGDA